MGLIISRFRRKKTTSEILERLETKIQSIERDGQYKEQTHKRVIGYMMAYSVGLYVLFAILYYFMYVGRNQHWMHSLFYASPLLVLPLLVILLRSTISWYYNRTLSKNRIQLNRMREEKKKILEEVMNTETYKVAKEILDKYGSPEEQSKALKPFVPSVNVPGTNTPTTPKAPATPGQLRQRQIVAMQTSTPISRNMNVVSLNTPAPLYKGPRLRSDQLPRPLLDKNRSALDKVVDYLLKDGPNQRMALICTECCSHNGMAMMEEFEYVSFVCAYCGKMNPARKQRPTAPLLSPLSPRTDPRGSPRALPAPRGSLPPGQPRALTVGDDSSAPTSASDSDEDQPLKANNVSNHTGSDCNSDRPPSPLEGDSKSEQEKKED